MIKRRPFLKFKLWPPSFPNKEIFEFDNGISIPTSNNANLVFVDIPCTQDYKYMEWKESPIRK